MSNKAMLAAKFREGKQRRSELFVLLHGLGCNKSSFQDIWTRPEFEPFSIVAPDFAGFGQSPRSKGRDYSMEAHASDVAQLLEGQQFKGRKLHIVGHSMGGVPALLLAEQVNNVASVTLLEGNLVATDCGVLSRQSAHVPLDELKDKVIPRLKTTLGADPSPGARMWATQINDADIEAFQKSAASLVEWSDQGTLPQKFLELPISRKLYIYGETSDQWRDSKQQITKIFESTNVQMLGIPNASHFIMNDNPEAFYSALADVA